MTLIRTAPHRLGAALMGVLLPLSVLVGCTGGDPEPQSTEPPSAESGSEPTESEPSEPVEPTPPAAMKGDDEAAAKAFVTYYFEVLDYASTTGDRKQLDALGIATCAACKGASQAIKRIYGDGGQLKGGATTVRKVQVASRGVLTQGVRPYDSLVTVRQARSTVVDTGDPEVDGATPESEFELRMQFSHGRNGWTMSAWSQT